jgi:hypothetical protein
MNRVHTLIDSMYYMYNTNLDTPLYDTLLYPPYMHACIHTHMIHITYITFKPVCIFDTYNHTYKQTDKHT